MGTVALKFMIFIFGGISATLLISTLFPQLISKYWQIHNTKAQHTAAMLDDMYVWVEKRKVTLLFFLSPLVCALSAYMMLRSLLMAVLFGVGGFFAPFLMVKQMHKKRIKKFQDQIPDAIISLSQSLKAGLSLVQAIEILVEEMPDPIAQEFSLLLKEHKMGVTLEKSFEKMNKKIKVDDLNFMTIAILVSHETGGDLPKVLANLSETIRQRNVVLEEVKTLTTQARWQGIIMSAIPIFFAFFVYNSNPHYFDIMLDSGLGRMLLMGCVVFEIIGAILLMKLSKIDI